MGCMFDFLTGACTVNLPAKAGGNAVRMVEYRTCMHAYACNTHERLRMRMRMHVHVPR